LQLFAEEYRGVVSKLQQSGKPLTVCTIYDCVPGLRLLCSDQGDYSEVSPIEPSDKTSDGHKSGNSARVIA
jgi:hypothetical protein